MTMIIGCDFHPRFQQIAYVDRESGEYGERPLNHPEEAAAFYGSLAGRRRKRRQTVEALPLEGWYAQRRKDLLALLDELDRRIRPLDEAVRKAAAENPDACRLMTHPAVGPVMALAYVLTIGAWQRFPRGKQVASYLGLIPAEASSADKRRLGHTWESTTLTSPEGFKDERRNTPRTNPAKSWDRISKNESPSRRADLTADTQRPDRTLQIISLSRRTIELKMASPNFLGSPGRIDRHADGR